jgi:hypothetical protein
VSHSHQQEGPSSQELSESAVLRIETDHLGQLNVSGRAVPPFLAAALVAGGPGLTVYVSGAATFPAWAVLVVVGIQVVAALAILVFVTRGRAGAR